MNQIILRYKMEDDIYFREFNYNYLNSNNMDVEKIKWLCLINPIVYNNTIKEFINNKSNINEFEELYYSSINDIEKVNNIINKFTSNYFYAYCSKELCFSLMHKNIKYFQCALFNFYIEDINLYLNEFNNSDIKDTYKFVIKNKLTYYIEAIRYYLINICDININNGSNRYDIVDPVNIIEISNKCEIYSYKKYRWQISIKYEYKYIISNFINKIGQI